MLLLLCALGKSQLLKAVNLVSPRGVLVTGGSCTAGGLTVTMVRSGSGEEGGDYTLEAGALVLGDSGTVCLDEFDKLHASQHSALLEAMEQQTISLAKAGMILTLPARTSVFAAANPQRGHYRIASAAGGRQAQMQRGRLRRQHH